MPVATFARCRKPGNNYIRLKFSDYPNHITQNFLFVPKLKSFNRTFCKAKIKSTGKKLFCAINSSGGKQFLRSDQTQRTPLFVAYEVLPAITACHAQVSGPV